MKTTEIKLLKINIKGPFSKNYVDNKTQKEVTNTFYVKTLETDKGNFIDYVKTPEIVEKQGERYKVAYETQVKEIGNETKEDNIILKTKLISSDPNNSSGGGIVTESTKLEDLKYFKLHGFLHYPHIKNPDTKGKFPTNKYKTDLTVDSKTAKFLTKLGVLVKEKLNDNGERDNRGQFVTIKSTLQPSVTDSEGNQLIDIPLIGNGSEALVTVALYDNKAQKGGKKCLGMNTVKILNLVPYQEAPLLTDLDITE